LAETLERIGVETDPTEGSVKDEGDARGRREPAEGEEARNGDFEGALTFTDKFTID
jgi:hypothetical protein